WRDELVVAGRIRDRLIGGAGCGEQLGVGGQWSQGGTGGGFQGAAYSAAQPEFEGDVEGQAAFDALPAAHVLCGGLLPERCEAFPFGQGGRQEAVPLGGVLTCAVDHGTHEGDQVGGGV